MSICGAHTSSQEKKFPPLLATQGAASSFTRTRPASPSGAPTLRPRAPTRQHARKMDRLRDLDAWKGALDGEHKISLMAQTIASLVLLIAITVKVDADRGNWVHRRGEPRRGFHERACLHRRQGQRRGRGAEEPFSVPIVGDITTNRLLATFLCLVGHRRLRHHFPWALPVTSNGYFVVGAASWPAWPARAAFTETTLKCSKALLAPHPRRRLFALVLPEVNSWSRTAMWGVPPPPPPPQVVPPPSPLRCQMSPPPPSSASPLFHRRLPPPGRPAPRRHFLRSPPPAPPPAPPPTPRSSRLRTERVLQPVYGLVVSAASGLSCGSHPARDVMGGNRREDGRIGLLVVPRPGARPPLGSPSRFHSPPRATATWPVAGGMPRAACSSATSSRARRQRTPKGALLGFWVPIVAGITLIVAVRGGGRERGRHDPQPHR